jgi:hypothetical protein
MFDEFIDYFTNGNSTYYFNTGTGTSGTNSTDLATTNSQFPMSTAAASTGTTATGRGYFGSAAATFFLGNGSALYFGRVFPLTMATAAQNFKVFTGFQNGSAAAMPTAMVGWAYDPSASTTNWQIAAFNSLGSTSSTTSLAVSNTQIVKLGAFVNGTGTSAEYFHAITDTVVFDGTIGTNIPTTSTNMLGVQTGITKNTGTTANWVEADFMGWRYQVPRGQ